VNWFWKKINGGKVPYEMTDSGLKNLIAAMNTPPVQPASPPNPEKPVLVLLTDEELRAHILLKVPKAKRPEICVLMDKFMAIKFHPSFACGRCFPFPQ